MKLSRLWALLVIVIAAVAVFYFRDTLPHAAGFVPFLLLGTVSPCRPFDAMRTATESLPDDLLRRASYQSPWYSAVNRGKYPQNKGVSQTVITIGNSEPETDEEQWSEITLSGQQITLNADANSSACDNDYTDVNVGFDETTYGPKQFQLRGPVICEDALTFHHNVDQFLAAYEQELSKRSRRSWENEMQNQYMIFSQKLVDGALVGGDGATNTAISGTLSTIPQSELTMDMLDYVASLMISSDVTNPDDAGYVTMGEEGPVFGLLIGVEMSSRITKNSPERRIDTRYAAPSELWKRMGATRVIGNFRHAIVTHPPRYNVVSGHLSRVPAKRMIDATHGKKAVDNPDYLAAEIEAAIVLVPTVFTAEIVVPHTGAAFAKFNPMNWNGDWSFITGAYRLGIDCDDPQDKLGRHYATYKYAPAPMFIDHGKTLFFKRCPQDIEKALCQAS